MERSNRQILWTSYAVVGYMLMAFTWWAVLLYTKNQDAFQAKAELLRIGMAAEQIYENENNFVQTPRYQQLASKYRNQELMIFGEALFFFITLLVGVWLIYGSYQKEMLAAQQRRNFLLSITHELKSPIASVRLMLETFLKRDLEKVQAQSLSKTALKETDRLTNLVDNLLLAAKIETAYQPVFEPVDVVELIQNLVKSQKEKFTTTSINFFSDEQSIILNVDKMGFTSVVLNLVENAVKYSLGYAEISIKIFKKVTTIEIEISDYGIGINDREKKRIFDKFYRVGNEDTRRTKGTGLGLYIVSQIVKAHDASIQVKDNKPKGVVFKLTFNAY